MFKFISQAGREKERESEREREDLPTIGHRDFVHEPKFLVYEWFLIVPLWFNLYDAVQAIKLQFNSDGCGLLTHVLAKSSIIL